MCQKVRKFAEVVKKVMNLGFDPSKVVFVIAVIVFHTMSSKTWEHKMEAAAVARVPNILSYSLERRIMPRCSVVRVLLLKGLIKTGIHLSAVLMPSEKTFLESFVIKHQEQLPQLLDLYQGKMNVTELGIGFDAKSRISVTMLCINRLQFARPYHIPIYRSVDGVLHNTARLHHHESIFRKVVQPNCEEEAKGSNRKANKTDLRSLECDIDPAHLSSTEKPDSGVSGNMAW
ncbi:hypothetical protein GH714_005921 [Hevea brasiliensis]|uniref:Uncharacterized protein n=1 Tax=Hevea brasiliensis TaxID=3981 RepID=A0A6A6NBQ8_HEVBR|nr:hypothetical protein GH714_005921 [Hevea brasiliensis]